MRHRFFAFLFVMVLLVSGNSVFSQNVNVAPAPATYATLGAAFTAINAGTHGAGAVTVSIVGNTVEPAPAILNGAVFTSCTITPNGSITVDGNFAEAVIVLDGADNVTIDGLNVAGNSLTITNTNTGAAQGCIRASNGASFNLFKNLTCNGVGVGSAIGGRTINIAQSTNGLGNNNNTIEDCVVNGGRRGVQTFGTAASVTNDNTIIRNSIIKNCSSLAVFIGSETTNNTVEGCEITNDAAVSAGADLRGINIQGVGTNIVRRNKIYGLNSTTVADFIGILVIPVLLTAPGSNVTSVEVSNNMVSLVENNVGSGSILGIYPSSIPGTTVPYTANVAYNSVLISGNDPGAAAQLSVGLYSDNGEATSVTNIYNNISLNTRFGGDANTNHVGGLIFDSPGNVTLNADYNIWTATDSVRGFSGGWNGTIYNSINQYKDSVNSTSVNELHTIFSTTFSYVSVTDLHLVPGSLGGSINGIPLAAITTDFDGNTRSASLVYRGADELPAGLFKTLTLNVGLEGAMPGPNDIITVGLAGSASPHNLIALATETVNGGTLQGRYYFGGAVANGTSYYLIAVNRNHLETWSATPITFTAGSASYNFTTALSQAYGSNQVTFSGVATLFGGDVNQDGTIDASDGADVDNDAFNFVSGNQRLTDVTNDQTTDASDAAITDNNAFNFIGVVTPPSPNGVSGKGLMSETNSRSAKITRNLKLVGTAF